MTTAHTQEVDTLRKDLEKAKQTIAASSADKKVIEQMTEILQKKAMEILQMQGEVDNLQRDLQVAKKRI